MMNEFMLETYLTSEKFQSNRIWKLCFSPCSKYLAIPKQDRHGYDCIVVIYCSNWHEFSIHEEFYCSSTVYSVAFSRQTIFHRSHLRNSMNHRYDFTKHLFLAAGLADGKINLWNVNTGELTLVLVDHKSIVCGLEFTMYSMQLVSCSHDRTVKFWDLLDDGNMYKTINESPHIVHGIRWSPNQRLLCVVGSHELVVLYDTMKWKEIFKFNGHLHDVIDCSFSSDSILLATASCDTRVLLWSTVTGECLKQFYHKTSLLWNIYAGGENDSFVRSVMFTRYDQCLITICDDNFIRVFPMQSPHATMSILKQQENNVVSMTMTSDGKMMAIGTSTGQVHLRSTTRLISTLSIPSLKSQCRIIINTYCSIGDKKMTDLSISGYLIDYLLYRIDK